jgi:hypothetical protein
MSVAFFSVTIEIALRPKSNELFKYFKMSAFVLILFQEKVNPVDVTILR